MAPISVCDCDGLTYLDTENISKLEVSWTVILYTSITSATFFDDVLHVILNVCALPVTYRFIAFYRAMHVVLARCCYLKSSVRPSVCP